MLVFAMFWPAMAALAEQPALPLTKLEERLAGSFALQAAQQHVESTAQNVQVETDKSGLRYTTNTNVGYRNDVITNTLNEQFGRFAQMVGLELPILGEKFAQNQSIQTASLDALSAVHDLATQQRIVLASLRDAYVLYWQYEREMAIADSYAASLSRALPGARGLRRYGFWTQGEFLQFLVSVAQARTEGQTSAGLRRAKLAQISAILGQDVSPFRSVAPAFADGCQPRLEEAVASAAAVDPDLARLAAQIAADQNTMSQLHGSSIDASAVASVGAVGDIPPRAGIALTVGVAGSLPTHARAEERAHRRALEDEIASLGFAQKQRLAEIRASVSEALDDFTNAKLVSTQSELDERSRREILRETLVRFNTIPVPGAAPFNDVQARSAELFVSSRAAAAAAATVLLKANQILLLSPGACDAMHHAPGVASQTSTLPIVSMSPAPEQSDKAAPVPRPTATETPVPHG